MLRLPSGLALAAEQHGSSCFCPPHLYEIAFILAIGKINYPFCRYIRDFELESRKLLYVLHVLPADRGGWCRGLRLRPWGQGRPSWSWNLVHSTLSIPPALPAKQKTPPGPTPSGASLSFARIVRLAQRGRRFGAADGAGQHENREHIRQHVQELLRDVLREFEQP